MTDETVKKINEAIESWYWKKDVGGIAICRGQLAPCSKVIDSGQCDTIIEILKKEENNGV